MLKIFWKRSPSPNKIFKKFIVRIQAEIKINPEISVRRRKHLIEQMVARNFNS